jgi:hypothetical protein
MDDYFDLIDPIYDEEDLCQWLCMLSNLFLQVVNDISAYNSYSFKSLMHMVN